MFTSNISDYFNFIFIPSSILLQVLIIFKLDFIEAISLVITYVIALISTELIAVCISTTIFKTNFEELVKVQNIKSISLFIQYTLFVLLIEISKYIILNISKMKKATTNINSKSISKIILLLIICIFPQYIIFMINKYNYPAYFLILNSLQIIIICIVLFNTLKSNLEKEKAENDLITSELHNKTMVGMVDGVRTLKHDYNNIIQALNGYVSTKQYDKLQEHINKVLNECNIVNNLGIINPKTFNDPAIYGIVGAKYFLAIESDIKVDLDITTNIAEIQFSMPDLSRILGIILDNAIEATSKCDNKYIRIEMKFDKRKCADVIRIINTYDTNIHIDLENIYKKGVSSKKIKSGIGLWEVKKLISKTKNAQVYATIEHDKFVQNLIIEKLV